ncbi:bifunctional transcriptional activator/DNA repair enzyme AdaA [Fusibacter ferrireducens]|uniref:Methylphosphotriester-DNA--protein-cysteine methyltransferase family protein n=1 Tax=Fusibacter ferrireducens TaxID=2785058 RepID=A0ABR9ZTL1_9FIRM|nr:Ada metal-binding domain-containing protein [Fusibacter ferrireducens]MBF4693483.1 methylphosphotriester-DNA--protein-cysteine methyltransferase family protein [Fusibacter ferrireducens]
MQLTHAEMWQAFIKKDSKFDGVFYTAVKTTGIFCKPSCRARKPLEKNVIFYNSADEAKQDGFRPCKICEPEGKSAGHLEDIVVMLKVYVDRHYAKQINFLEFANQNGLSQNHLTRAFKKACNMTPKAYLAKVRIDHARVLLKETHEEILKITYDVGFLSISSFYKHFKMATGTSPKKFRECPERTSIHG